MFSIITQFPLPDGDYTELSQAEVDKYKDDWIKTQGGYSRNHDFNKLAYKLFTHKPLYILDIGCGGGNFIEDCIHDGHIAAGIDGWMLYKQLGLNAWGRFPNNFVQADIGKPFQIQYNNLDVKFDLITSWECFEHIKQDDVGQLAINISNHIKPNGYLIFSVSHDEKEVAHRTIQNKDWWLKQFTDCGFMNTDINFGPNVVRNCPRSSIIYLQYLEG